MAWDDPLYRKGVTVASIGGPDYAVTAWEKITNIPNNLVLYDVMCWRATYEEAHQWAFHAVHQDKVNGVVYLHEKAGRKILIKKAPFFSLLGHIEWRDVDVNKSVP